MVGIVQHVYTDVVPDGTATSVVRPSDWNSAHNQTISLGGNTVGSAIISGTNVVLAGGNNVTLSGDSLNSRVLVSAGAIGGGTFSAGVSNIGNTLGNTGVVSNQMVLAGGANITLSQSTNAGGATVTISGGAGGGGATFSAGVSTGGNTAGNTGTVSNQVVFAGGNNITLSESTVAGGSATITISAPNQSVQPVGSFGISNLGNTVGTSSTTTNQMILAGGNNITLSENTGAGGITITISGPNTVAQTNQSEGIYAVGNTTGQSSSSTYDARTLSVNGAGIISAGWSNSSLVISATTPSQTVQPVGTFGMSNLGNTVGTSSMVTNQIVFAGGNNITLSESTAAGGVTLTISGPNTVAQSNQTDGVYASGNTTGNSSSLTHDARSLTIEGFGGVSVGWSTNNSHLLISGPQTVAQTNQTIGVYGVGNTTGQSSSSTVDARSLSFDGAGVASVGMSGGSVVISVPPGGGGDGYNIISLSGNTAGVLTTFLSATMNLAGGNNITLSQTSNSITISAANQTNQSLGIYATGNTTGTSSSSTYDARSLTIEADGIISAGWSTAAGKTVFAISATTPAQTNQTIGIYGVGNTAGQSSSSTVDARSLSFDGAGVASVGMSGGSVVISVPAGGGGGLSAGISGGNTSGNTGTVSNQLVFAGGNNITLSGSTAAGGETITISAFNQSVQPVGTFGMSNIGNSVGTSSMVTNQIVFAGGNNITLSESTAAGGVTLTISGPNTAAQSVQTLGIYATGNTTGTSSSSTYDARSLTVEFDGIISGGWSTAAGKSVLAISATTPSQTVQPVGTFGMSNLGNTSGTSSMVTNQMVLVGSNSITLSESTAAGGITITISGASSNSTEGAIASGNTTGNSSSLTFDPRSLTIEAFGGVSVGWSTNNSHLLISGPQTVAQSNQTEGYYALGNTTGQSSSTTLDARTHSINGGGIISVGYSGGSILVSATTPAQTVQPVGTFGMSNLGNTAGTSSMVTNQMVLVGSNSITLSESTAAGGITITISGASSNSTEGVIASGNTTGNSSSLTFDPRSLTIEGFGGVSVGWSSNNSHLLISGPQTAAQTNQTLGIYATGNTTGTSSSSTYDARSLTIEGDGMVSVGWSTAVGKSVLAVSATQSNQSLGIYASGNTTGNSTSLTHDARSLSIEFDGIVSGGWSTNNSHLHISASQSAQTIGLYHVGNTTGQSSSSTVDARSLSFDGAGIASVGMSAGSVLISVPSGGGGGDGVNIIEISGNTTGTSTTYLSATLALAGGNNITLSQSQSTITISAANQTNQTLGLYAVGNTTGQSSSTTVDARTISFNGTGDVSVGYSGGSVLVSQPVVSEGSFGPLGGGAVLLSSGVAHGSLSLCPLVVPRMMIGSVGRLVASVNLVNTAPGASTSVSTTVNGSGGTTINFVLYSVGTGGSSTAIYTMSSISLSLSATCLATESSKSQSVRFTVGYPSGLANSTSFNTTTYSTSSSTTFGGVNPITTLVNDNNLEGPKIIFFPCVTTLSAGNYVLGVQALTAGSAVGPVMSIGLQGMEAIQTSPAALMTGGYIGASSATTSPVFGLGGGMYSVSFSSALQSAIAFSDINAGYPIPFGNIINAGT